MRHIRANEVEGIRAPAPHERTLKHLITPWTVGSENLWVGLSEVDPCSSSNPHVHPNEEVFYVVSGYGEVVVDGQRSDVSAGSAVLVPSGAEHQLVNTSHEVLRVLCSVAPAFDRSVFDHAHELDEQRGELDAMPLAAPAVARAEFPREEFADELERAEQNTTVGKEIWFENDRVRVWGISLQPGERLPFHCHTDTYFWVCVDPSTGRQRYPSGAIDTFEFRNGDVDFIDIAPGRNVIHDLENSGGSELRFIAIELLKTAG